MTHTTEVASASERADSPADSVETTVLVVDDEQSLVEMYAANLETEYDVLAAYDGEEALQKIDETVDVVLLDRRMPGMSGSEVLEAIHRRGYDCRVVIMTGVEPDFDIIELGFDGYLVKPIDAEELHESIEQVTRRAAYEGRLQEYYALREKRDTLRAAKPQHALEASEEYEELERELESVREEIESFLSEFEDERFAAAIERTRGVSAIRESEQRYRSLTEDALDTSQAGTIIVDADCTVVWANAAIERYLGIDREGLLERDYRSVVRDRFPEIFDGDDGDATERVLDALAANDGVVEFECHVAAGASREDRWLTHWSKPIETGLYAGGRIEHYYDVTAIKRRERTLETLHERTRRLIDAETRPETAARIVDAASEVLGFSLVALYLWEDDSGSLVPAASTDAVGSTVELTDVSGDNPLWEAFVEGEPTTGVASAVGFPSELLLPIGQHGVLVVGDETQQAFDDVDRSFARLLTTTAEIVLDRTDRERALRRRDEELEQRNQQLARLNRINTIVRGIGRALVGASSREEIEQAVCDRLVQVDSYEYVWIGERDVVDQRLVPRASAGDGQDYLDQIRMPSAETGGPAWETVETGEPRTVGNILEDPAVEPWRVDALNRGFRSVAYVPFVYEESVYGLAEIYADSPFAFDDMEREVLAELGHTIGHAINAIKRKDALLADAGIELEFELGEGDGFFLALADTVEEPIDVRTVIPASDGSAMAFFAIEDAVIEEVIAFANGASSVSDVEVIRERDDAVLFKCQVQDDTVITTIAEHGAVPRSLTAERGSCRAVCELPTTADVRGFADALSARYPDAELLARRERPTDGERTLQERVADSLTDRQREALQAAYFAGYFEWPREASGEEIAESMGITQPTLQQHLRVAERKLLGELLDGSTPR